MAAEFSPVTPDVLEIAQELISIYHADLQDASIGFLFKEGAEPATEGARVIFGKAKKVSPDVQALGIDFDFIVWIDSACWHDFFDHKMQMAAIDHLSTWCAINDDGKTSLRKPDVVEFNSVLQRHGLWWPGADATKEALQQQSLFGVLPQRTGRVASVDPNDLNSLFGEN